MAQQFRRYQDEISQQVDELAVELYQHAVKEREEIQKKLVASRKIITEKTKFLKLKLPSSLSSSSQSQVTQGQINDGLIKAYESFSNTEEKNCAAIEQLQKDLKKINDKTEADKKAKAELEKKLETANKKKEALEKKLIELSTSKPNTRSARTNTSTNNNNSETSNPLSATPEASTAASTNNNNNNNNNSEASNSLSATPVASTEETQTQKLLSNTEAEIQTLSAKLSTASKKIAKNDQKKEELKQQESELKNALGSLKIEAKKAAGYAKELASSHNLTAPALGTTTTLTADEYPAISQALKKILDAEIKKIDETETSKLNLAAIHKQTLDDIKNKRDAELKKLKDAHVDEQSEEYINLKEIFDNFSEQVQEIHATRLESEKNAVRYQAYERLQELDAERERQNYSVEGRVNATDPKTGKVIAPTYKEEDLKKLALKEYRTIKLKDSHLSITHGSDNDLKRAVVLARAKKFDETGPGNDRLVLGKCSSYAARQTMLAEALRQEFVHVEAHCATDDLLSLKYQRIFDVVEALAKQHAKVDKGMRKGINWGEVYRGLTDAEVYVAHNTAPIANDRDLKQLMIETLRPEQVAEMLESLYLSDIENNENRFEEALELVVNWLERLPAQNDISRALIQNQYLQKIKNLKNPKDPQVLDILQKRLLEALFIKYRKKFDDQIPYNGTQNPAYGGNLGFENQYPPVISHVSRFASWISEKINHGTPKVGVFRNLTQNISIDIIQGAGVFDTLGGGNSSDLALYTVVKQRQRDEDAAQQIVPNPQPQQQAAQQIVPNPQPQQPAEQPDLINANGNDVTDRNERPINVADAADADESDNSDDESDDNDESDNNSNDTKAKPHIKKKHGKDESDEETSEDEVQDSSKGEEEEEEEEALSASKKKKSPAKNDNNVVDRKTEEGNLRKKAKQHKQDMSKGQDMSGETNEKNTGKKKHRWHQKSVTFSESTNSNDGPNSGSSFGASNSN